MKKSLFLMLFTFFSIFVVAQNIEMQFEPSVANPFGLPNPNAPKEIMDFDPMIGICDCKSVNRNPDGTWQDTMDMIWKFKYIMNGTAVQDEVWRPGELYAGSIRMFHIDSAKWVVSYFSYPAVIVNSKDWLGKKNGNEIVLWKDQASPNGMHGDSRLTFYNITEEGYDWKGEWVSKDKTIVYPFWKIFCKKRK